MRRIFVVALVVGSLIAVSIRVYRMHRPLPMAEAYAGSQGVTVWNSTAEVRTPITTLAYGQPVQIAQRNGNMELIETTTKIRGWVSADSLLDASVWHEESQLSEMTKVMPIQARGFTRVPSNLHTRAGRHEPVIAEALAQTPVLLLERKVVPHDGAKSAESGAGQNENAEDWWLVRAQLRNVGEVSGWVLGRFVDPDLPSPLAGYQSSESMKIVSWYEINKVANSSGGVKSEFLVTGSRDGDGRPCDFTLLRVYTWSDSRQRYETAFVEGGICGNLPVQVTPARISGGDAYFRFQNRSADGVQMLQYRMRSTTVRRIDRTGTTQESRR
ncbi:MAG TPA: hypothetical protein VGR81_12490 [Candidatus Acidoferrales bacterium]|nr:hypothetical protein [Candidatus Acidoferrales bacterium]